MTPLPSTHRHLLMTEETSRQNKLWLAAGWQFQGWFVEWRWAGDGPKKNGLMRSRLQFRFAPEEKFVDARSFDEDVMPTFKFGKEGK